MHNLPAGTAASTTVHITLKTSSSAGPGPYRTCPSAPPRSECPRNRAERRAASATRRRGA